MKILAGARQSGKTRKLIEAARATNGYILVHSNDAYEYCARMGMPRDRILRIGDFRNGNMRGRTLNGPVYVDNMELVFKQLFNDYAAGKFSANLVAATVNLTQEEIDLMFTKFVIEDIIIDPPKEP